jgi:DNA-binding MurR/RpiR family transcriptional regulator
LIKFEECTMDNNLHTRLRIVDSQLSRSERRLAEVVSRLGNHLLQYSAIELAEYAQVSQSTVTRFFRRLGYKHYRHALKEVLSSPKVGSLLVEYWKNLMLLPETDKL